MLTLELITSPPRSIHGYIKVTETATGKDYGFLSKDLNNFGEFQMTSDSDQRAIFSINLADAAQGQTNIAVVSISPNARYVSYPYPLSLSHAI